LLTPLKLEGGEKNHAEKIAVRKGLHFWALQAFEKQELAKAAVGIDLSGNEGLRLKDVLLLDVTPLCGN